jgi:hypothetical protein
VNFKGTLEDMEDLSFCYGFDTQDPATVFLSHQKSFCSLLDENPKFVDNPLRKGPTNYMLFIPNIISL